ncbi:MAG: YiiX/YebB-like N1pC/P60 family cysteine hydrolase [Alistipes sp.]
MIRPLLYIGVLLLSASCHPEVFRPASGDLLFQVNKSSEMTDAITATTGANFSHVAIAVHDDEADSVIEATSEGGVRVVSLADFLSASAQIANHTAVVVMRLRDTTGITGAAVQRAHQFIGQPYDYSYQPHNNRMYCSELVWESYLDRQHSEHLFTARPMNFRNTAGELPDFWVQLFAAQGEPVPEGVMGTNPNDLSKEPLLREVHCYFR